MGMIGKSLDKIAAFILTARQESSWKALHMADLQAIWSVLTAIVLCLLNFVLDNVVVVRCCNMAFWECIVMALPIQLIALDCSKHNSAERCMAISGEGNTNENCMAVKTDVQLQ